MLGTLQGLQKSCELKVHSKLKQCFNFLHNLCSSNFSLLFRLTSADHSWKSKNYTKHCFIFIFYLAVNLPSGAVCSVHSQISTGAPPGKGGKFPGGKPCGGPPCPPGIAHGGGKPCGGANPGGGPP